METDFDAWADVYDAVYSYVTDDIPFYVDEALRCGGPVLELGCGTGRVTLPIARVGVEVTGLDSSQRMLDAARRKTADTPVRLVHGDMREFSLGRRFALVIIPFRGFLSLLTVEDQMSALACIRRHLAPGGRLVFNVFDPDLNMLVQPGDGAYHLRDVADPESGRRLVIWHQSSCDNHNQIIYARLIVDELDGSGAVAGRFYRDFRLRYAHRWEIHHLLTSAGYEVVDLYGDFDRSPFDEESEEMVWIARPTPE